MSDKTAFKKGDAAVRVGLRQKFDDLDALLDLSHPTVFAARRELGKAVGAALDNATVSAKTFPPYGEKGPLTEPPASTEQDGARRGIDYRCPKCGRDRPDGAAHACMGITFDGASHVCMGIAFSDFASRRASPASTLSVQPEDVTRFEVIDHRADSMVGLNRFGRVFTAHNATVELSYQDDGRTLKVFVNDRPADPPEKTTDG